MDDDDTPSGGVGAVSFNEPSGPEVPLAPTAEPNHVVNPINTPA
ncbi:hypothetical protein HCTV-8_gp71 [Haloarcula virus HCTV-8]|uniref:Uncharacterized protein n=4 Tax=Haloferacalesvirus TaxID=2843389 RepID=A0AAE8XUQ9_9CAUD|nr:hypothetical protein M194_gp051 [Halorubrum tailed phage 5]UBF20398.1 hypothetical protein HCTV-7_gp73 [Haloarcula phage HCTV-7]UBF20514.1 hypothetical protein HCTV-9_gp73 [Haloarcula phage HCTV-9]UBF20630.1 hypothetical protein HCTV-11_gp73 [Haloarcula phage HCTV-11]UBF20746.1 hypothetical protein HRTV-9_gp73 [Halorubrum virus HRTV-9]UBF20859.1 hypothetical protein HRTV-16_gp73 [Halorubrum virus HRTV-16]UBF20970.1 hypothetical protein HCTV-8_gp71 [Haloarcula virus HCTV-8]UBF21082.1 hypot